MSYNLLAKVYWSVCEPDGGVSIESETVECDGDKYETMQQAEEALERAKRYLPNAEIWISERGD